MEFYLAFGIDWPSVIGVLDKGAPKRLSLFAHRRIASECHLEKWAQGSRSWAARSTLWSQFLIFPSWKRPSAQSTESIQRPSVQSAEGNQSPIMRNAEGMESPFVWRAKVRAYLCELKSRRSLRKILSCEKPKAWKVLWQLCRRHPNIFEKYCSLK